MKMRILLLLALITALPALAETTASFDKTGAYQRSGRVVGGKLTDGRDIRRIRWARQEGYERIVLDVYAGNYDGLGPAVPRACHFEVSYDPETLLLKVAVAGTRRFTATFPNTAGSGLVRSFKKIPVYDDSAHSFSVQLASPVEYEVFELKNPGRIVIDLRPR